MMVLVLLCAVSASADKKEKKAKTNYVEVDMECEPDPLPKQSKPDTYIMPLESPLLFYDGGAGLCGFDMSHYQGKVDFDQLATDPNAGFMYLKASEGASNQDFMYDIYFDNSKRVGMKVGSYHFFRANVPARVQFDNFMGMVRNKPQDLIPIIDVEALAKGVSMVQFYDCLSELLVLVEREYGRKPMIYTGQNFYNKHFHGTKFVGNYKFMIACYQFEEPVLNDNDDFLIWQFTGHGKARGVKGQVDISKFVRGHTLREIMM